MSAVSAGVGDGKPIRMTQALTDSDGRVRDLLERPLTAGEYRLEFDVAREDGSFFTKMAVDLSNHGCRPESPRAAAPRAVLDDDLPGQLSAALLHVPERVDVEARDGRTCR